MYLWVNASQNQATRSRSKTRLQASPWSLASHAKLRMEVYATAHPASSSTVPDNRFHIGCSLTSESSYTVGVSVTVGAELGLNLANIASAGINGAVSTSTETAQVSGAGHDCPEGPWTCALIITPSMIEASGTQTRYAGQFCEEYKDKFTVQFPRKGDDQTSSAKIGLCVCKNYKSWADKGAPTTICPGDCP